MTQGVQHLLSRSADWRRSASRHPTGLDIVLAFGLVGATLGLTTGVVQGPPRSPSAADLVTMVVAFATIAGRSRWPRTALLTATATAVAQASLAGNWRPLLLFAEGLAAFTVATRLPRRTAWPLAAACAVAAYLANALGVFDRAWSPDSLLAVAFIGMATAFGDATRNRRAYLAEVEERARRAEQSREEEARRRVIQERLRIARELHDVVAHHIAVINIQAGGADRALDRRPDQVRPALAHIRRASDAVLKELGSIVGVLRQSDDPAAPTEPTRGLARLPDLLDTVRAAGLRVDYRQVGAGRDLPAVVDLAAYRIVQESLTNANKYGTGHARLTITYADHGVQVDVVNIVASWPLVAGSGYGIVGMRERAAAAAGTLEAYAQPTGRFTVHAELPAPIEENHDDSRVARR